MKLRILREAGAAGVGRAQSVAVESWPRMVGVSQTHTGAADGKSLRIACSGLVAAGSGSLSSAGYLVLEELLARGHQIDFYSKRSYVYPEQLVGGHEFRYVDCSRPSLDRAVGMVRNRRARWLVGWIPNQVYMRRLMRRMRQTHSGRPYDLVFFIGQWAFGRVEDVPVVSWVQGAPGTDARSIARHAGMIKRLCGVAEYLKLRAYAMYRTTPLGRPCFEHTDVPICGSRASRATLEARYPIAPGSARSSAYPIDLALFRPGSAVTPVRPLEVVWVGRIVPRKRLDLFLGACSQLIDGGRDIRVTVVGGFPFAQGFRQLIDDFPHPDRLVFVPHMPRESVLALLQVAAVVVQPSEEEDFGSAIAEALAAGTPVVVGPTNGTGEYVGAAGFRFARYCREDVAGAITHALDRMETDPATMRDHARAAAEKHFAVHRVADQLEGILREALGG